MSWYVSNVQAISKDEIEESSATQAVGNEAIYSGFSFPWLLQFCLLRNEMGKIVNVTVTSECGLWLYKFEKFEWECVRVLNMYKGCGTNGGAGAGGKSGITSVKTSKKGSDSLEIVPLHLWRNSDFLGRNENWSKLS